MRHHLISFWSFNEKFYSHTLVFILMMRYFPNRSWFGPHTEALSHFENLLLGDAEWTSFFWFWFCFFKPSEAFYIFFKACLKVGQYLFSLYLCVCALHMAKRNRLALSASCLRNILRQIHQFIRLIFYFPYQYRQWGCQIFCHHKAEVSFFLACSNSFLPVIPAVTKVSLRTF